MRGAALIVRDYRTDRLAYSEALAAILDRLHTRYQIGFHPQFRDGKVHSLTVQFTDAIRGAGTPRRSRLVIVAASASREPSARWMSAMANTAA